jgi:hypothetical protein
MENCIAKPYKSSINFVKEKYVKFRLRFKVSTNFLNKYKETILYYVNNKDISNLIKKCSENVKNIVLLHLKEIKEESLIEIIKDINDINIVKFILNEINVNDDLIKILSQKYSLNDLFTILSQKKINLEKYFDKDQIVLLLNNGELYKDNKLASFHMINSPHITEVCINDYNYKDILYNPNTSEDMLEKIIQDKILNIVPDISNVKGLCRDENYEQKIFLTELFCNRQNLSKEFMFKYYDYINWQEVSTYNKSIISKEFLEELSKSENKNKDYSYIFRTSSVQYCI